MLNELEEGVQMLLNLPSTPEDSLDQKTFDFSTLTEAWHSRLNFTQVRAVHIPSTGSPLKTQKVKKFKYLRGLLCICPNSNWPDSSTSPYFYNKIYSLII